MKQYIGTKVISAEPKTNPKGLDGYKVVYEDGYESWSPKDVFEKAYKESGNLSFGDAIYFLKNGKKIARSGWNGKGIFIELQVPDKSSKMTHPYIFIDTTGLETTNEKAPKSRVPWLASQTDMLSEDWCILE